MLFDLTANSNSRELMVLDQNYPKDVTAIVTPGQTETVSFEAIIAVHGKPEEYIYQWYENGAPVEGANNAVYTREVSATTDVYDIYCNVTNKKGTASTRVAKLSTHYVPVLEEAYPHDITVARGTSVTSEVVISNAGNPAEYTYQWYVNGSAVEGATEASYTFTMEGIGTASVYCEVSNIAGTVKSKEATIKEYYDIVPNTAASWSTYRCSVSRSDSQSVFSINSANDDWGYASCKVDVTPYSVMHIKCSGSINYGSGNEYCNVGLSNSNGGSLAVGYSKSGDSGFSFEQDYDISQFEGTKYFVFRFMYDKNSDPKSVTYTATKVRFSA